MSSPFVAEIRMFACNFAPTGWALCNGQILPISQNTALFSLLGTTYGGDGKSNFSLPNLQNSAPMHPGQGSGLTDRVLGESGGESLVTLITSEMPSHSHIVNATANFGSRNSPVNTTPGTAPSGNPVYKSGAPNTSMDFTSTSAMGGGGPHNNMPPYLTLTFCIALQGVFPSRG
jgi:microcystin-dependent protein